MNWIESPEKMETKIAIYYSNNILISYFDILQKVKNKYTNYYKYEKESINNEIWNKWSE